MPTPCPDSSTYLGRDTEDPQCDNDGELLREVVTVDEEPGGREDQGTGLRGSELETTHSLHFKHSHAMGQSASRDHLREDVQGVQVCVKRQRSTSRQLRPPDAVPLRGGGPA